MAESQHTTKRKRDSEGALVDIHEEKRYKSSSNQIVSTPNKLEEEGRPPRQQELLDPLLLSGPSPTEESAPYHQTPCTLVASPSSAASAGEEDDKEKMIRHLLEASDDELGLPNRIDFNGDTNFDNVGHSVFSVCDGGLWELEDEAANYYTLLQAQLFMY